MLRIPPGDALLMRSAKCRHTIDNLHVKRNTVDVSTCVNVYIFLYMFVYVCICINCIYVVLSYVRGNKESIYLTLIDSIVLLAD